MRAMQVSFNKRKACIMKKTMELSVLCDLQACAVIIDDNGEVTTWPENQCEVMKVLQRYRAWCSGADHGREKKAVPAAPDDDPLEWDDGVLEDLLKVPLEELFNAGVAGEDDQHLLVEVDSKIHAVMERIEFLKSAGEYGRVQTPPFLLEYTQDQSGVPITTASSEVQSGIDTNQTPCFSEYSWNQQNMFYIPAMPSGPCEVNSAVETIQDPCFFEYVMDQHDILDTATTPGFFKDVPVTVAEQGFHDMVPRLVGDNSELFHMVPQLDCFGEIPEQFDPQLSSMNWNYDFFSCNSY